MALPEYTRTDVRESCRRAEAAFAALTGPSIDGCAEILAAWSELDMLSLVLDRLPPDIQDDWWRVHGHVERRRPDLDGSLEDYLDSEPLQFLHELMRALAMNILFRFSSPDRDHEVITADELWQRDERDHHDRLRLPREAAREALAPILQ